MKHLFVILVGSHSSVREGADATTTLRHCFCLLAVGSPGTGQQQLRQQYLADHQISAFFVEPKSARQKMPHGLQAVDVV